MTEGEKADSEQRKQAENETKEKSRHREKCDRAKCRREGERR